MKNTQALTRVNQDLLHTLSVIAKAKKIPQYQALDEAIGDWIQKHQDAVFLGLPDTPPPKPQPPEKKRKTRKQ